MKENFGKRLLSLFLALSMVITLIPSSFIRVDAAATTDEPIYVLAGGDFQAGDDGQEDHYYSRINMGNILDKIKEKYSTMNGFIFVGDYDGDTHNDSNATTGIVAMMEEVTERFTALNHDNSILMQGNHESANVVGIDPTGGYEFDGYAVYSMNQSDYCEKQTGKGSQIQTVADNLETWLNNKIGEGYDAPIFVTAHVPLAYGTRTYTNGDGLYAKYVFDVLNEAADNGLNIIFLHGHDHAYGADNYLGGEAIYLKEGDSINIAVPGDKADWTEETLNFTYMNAGYVGYYNENYYDVTSYEAEKLTMTVFKIENNQVTVERYSKDGLYNLKSEGREGFYANSGTCAGIGLTYNTTVYASPQTITLTENNAEDLGTTGEYVGIQNETPVDDVTTSNKGWVELIAPIPGTPEVPATPASTKYVYTLDTDGTVTDKADDAQGYLVVGSGSANAMTDSLGATGVTITDNAITLDAQPDYEWWITSDGKITDGTNWLAASIDWRSGSISVTTNENDAYSWTINHSGNGAYQITGKYSGYWTTTYYLRYSNNAFSISDSSNTVRLFNGAEVTTPAIEGTPATPDTNGTYGKIVGNLTYNATVGMSADAAMALVKAGIDGYYYNSMSTPGTDVTGTIVDDSVLTWQWVDTFDGNIAGDYEVAIKYGDFLLGTAEVVVPPTTTYCVAEGNHLYLVDMGTTADNAMAAVKAGITVYSATDTNGTNKTEVSDEDVTWNWVDTYNGADSGPYTVEILYNGTSLGTVEVKVNVKYETGINTDWTYIGESTATGGTHTYTLDTDGIDVGSENKYIIVARDKAYLLDAGSAVEVTISSDGKTVTTTSRDYEYYFTGSTGGLITRDGTNTLYQQNWGIHTGYIEDSNLDAFTNLNNGYYRLYDNDGGSGNNERSLYYNGSSWTVTSSDHENEEYSIRLYKYTGTTGGTSAGSIYAKIEGNTVYTVEQGTTTTAALNKVKAGITGYISNNEDGSNPTELDDSKLTWKWKNTYASMVTGSYWVEISYNGEVLGTVEVRVEPGVVKNYPEYPNEGAVKVNKTGTGIDFQSSGIAQIEISASGVPIKKGADVIIMVDTSSSMESWCVECDARFDSSACNHDNEQDSYSRASVFEESLENLIAQLQQKGDDGLSQDIRVALADFNGFNGYNSSASYGTPYDREENDTTNDTAWYSATNQAKVYTGDGTLTSGAFVSASELPTDSSKFNFNYVSGTNYDYAFDAIYQLGNSIKSTNSANGEARDLYVIFMSDGAPMQYNYYHSQGESSNWQYWLTGTVENNGGFSTVVKCQDHIHYYDETNGNKHRMAQAVKGDVDTRYEVIRKATTGLESVLVNTDEENMYTLPGLGATMFSIAFDPVADGNTPASAMTHVLEDIASEQVDTTQYYYLADTAEDLANAFTSIGSHIAYAATNARFVDQMGDNYNLQLSTSTYEVVDNGETVEKTLAPVIEIFTYDIYTKAEADAVAEGTDGDTVTNSMIGDRKGTKTLKEVVKFSTDGTEAYSNLIDVDKDGNYGVTVNSDGTYSINDADDNIIGENGVIYAITFLYNTTSTDISISGVDIPTGIKNDETTTGSSTVLPAETFYWKLGTVQTSELAMRYYVYLDGSMEGTREAGSYPTNEYAILYYDNYLGNSCYKETVSPVMAWKEANVSYAFYLVNKDGEIIVNQTTGLTGSFANKIAVTNPVVYETVLLNSDEEVSSIDIASLGVLPEGYTLYDYDGTNGAKYTVNIKSNTAGSWEIESVKDVATTYVMQYNPEDASAYSNEKEISTVGLDYTHTVVWFAVLWEVQALPDTVVVDYGLPVDISVLVNDMFGENGKLAGVGAYTDDINFDGFDTNLNSGFGSSYDGEFGKATTNAETGKVHYDLQSMKMDGYEKFVYAVNYTGSTNSGYYYDTVTVIPATTIYYEDDYVEYATYNSSDNSLNNDDKYKWIVEGTITDAVQDEDRPGYYSLTDANNIYGYDSAYKNMSTYSLGSTHKVFVDKNVYAQAKFSFVGTGFDVIGLTSNDTGVLIVSVTNSKGEESLYIVDTYYGYTFDWYKITYTYDSEGNWVESSREYSGVEGTSQSEPENPTEGLSYYKYEKVWKVDNNADNALYQIPVMQIENLPYDNYDVKITASYSSSFDHNDTEEGYDLYLDAIRIYDPAGIYGSSSLTEEQEEIKNAYIADGEHSPEYTELRDLILTEEEFTSVNIENETSKLGGIVFIDGDGSNMSVSDYNNYGPNNEVYLAKGQSIVFKLDLTSYGDLLKDVHLGIKSANGDPVTYSIFNIEETTNSKYTKIEENIKTVSTTTDMYYSILKYTSKTIVITNTGDGILSLTNLKITEIEPKDTDSASAAAEVYVTPQMVSYSLRVLNYVAPTTFAPAVFEVTVDETVEVGTDVNVNVTTSTDVEYIYVNDTKVSTYVDDATTGLRTFTTTVPTTEVGTLTVIVTGYNIDDLPTETQCYAEVIVTEKTFTPETLNVNVVDATVVGTNVWVTVSTSTDVEYVTVNGVEVTTYTTSKRTGLRTFTTNIETTKVGTLEVNVVAYDSEGTASETVTNTVTVKDIETIIKDIFGWIFG